MSPARPDQNIMLLATYFPLVCLASLILFLKVKGFLFFDFGREERKRPRLLAAPILMVLTLVAGSNALFHKEQMAGVAYLVLCAAVIVLSLTKSSREAQAVFAARIQADLSKKDKAK